MPDPTPYSLALQAHGHLAVLTAIHQLDPATALPGNGGVVRDAVTQSLGGLLLDATAMTADAVAVVVTEVIDHHLDVLDEGGTDLQELIDRFAALLEQHPHRHFHVVLTSRAPESPRRLVLREAKFDATHEGSAQLSVYVLTLLDAILGFGGGDNRIEIAARTGRGW